MSDKALADEIGRIITRDFGGDHIAANLVRAARHSGLQVSLACAVGEQETRFKNVYGHDGVRNPIKSPPNGLKRVTRANYKLYKAYRRAGLGMQGVGIVQLTYFTYQDEADKLGGCWNPYWNMLVGFRALHANIQTHGEAAGIAHYNGVGAAAQAYSSQVRHKAAAWHDRLT